MARAVSESGIYHVVSRGSGRQLIFEDDVDRMSFITTLGESARRAGICSAEQYDWSSYREYAGGVPRVEVADTSLVLEMLGGQSGFVELCRDDAKGVEPYAPMGLCRGTDEVVIAAVDCWMTPASEIPAR